MIARWLFAVLLGSSASGCVKQSETPRSPPESHTPAFVVDHRMASADCAACHGPDPCARCHATRPPRDHRGDFSASGHGFSAAADGARCATCHTETLCGRCHR